MLSGCEFIDTENIMFHQLQTSYSVEQGNMFHYQSYSHSDDMFIILKSNINTDIWFIYGFRYLYIRGKNHIIQNIYSHYITRLGKIRFITYFVSNLQIYHSLLQ
jgi:hypothetical protein